MTTQTGRAEYETFIRSNPDPEMRQHDVEHLAQWDALGEPISAALNAALIAERFSDQMRAFQWTHGWIMVKAYAGNEMAEVAKDSLRNTGQVGLALDAAIGAGQTPAALDPIGVARAAIEAYDQHEINLLGHPALREGDPEPKYPKLPLYMRMHPEIDWQSNPGLMAEEDDY